MVYLNDGRIEILNFLATEITHFAIGDGSAAEDPESTTMNNEIFRKTVLSATVSEAELEIDIECFLGASEGNGTIREWGLFDAAAAGNMHVHEVMGADETKTDAMEMINDIIIEVN